MFREPGMLAVLISQGSRTSNKMVFGIRLPHGFKVCGSNFDIQHTSSLPDAASAFGRSRPVQQKLVRWKTIELHRKVRIAWRKPKS